MSWIGRAEACDGDDDARFIFLWIAFNAAYADEREFQSTRQGERTAFLDYFGRLTASDSERRIYKAVRQRFSGPVRLLLENLHVFDSFWQHDNGIDGFADWEDRFEASARSLAQAFQAGDSAWVLSFVFDRLYVLRNQLVHGGATWNSGVNRAQVRDGAAILAFLVPVFVDLMMENPAGDWGRPFYPVVLGSRSACRLSSGGSLTSSFPVPRQASLRVTSRAAARRPVRHMKLGGKAVEAVGSTRARLTPLVENSRRG